MTEDQIRKIAKALAPALVEIGRQIDALAADVAELKEMERERMQRAYLAAWPHAGVPRNGHHRERLQ